MANTNESLPDAKKSYQEQLKEDVACSKCLYTYNVSSLGSDGYMQIEGFTLYRSPANQTIKMNRSSAFDAYSGMHGSSAVSFERLSAEKAETLITKTAQTDSQRFKLEGRLVRVLKVSIEKGLGIDTSLRQDSIFLVNGKHVLHQFVARVVSETNGRPITSFFEAIYPFTTDTIDEITPETFTELCGETAIFRKKYVEAGFLIDIPDDYQTQFMPILQSTVNGHEEQYKKPVSEAHEGKQVLEQLPKEAKPVDTIEKLLEIVENEDLSVLICSHEDGTRGLIFDHLRHPFKTILRNFNGTCWDVYYETESATKAENIHRFDSLQEACQKALEYARASKKLPGMADAETNHQILYWVLDESGILTLSGKGPMAKVALPEYRIIDDAQLAFELEYGDWMLSVGDVDSRATLPWNGEKVRKVIIEPGLTTVSCSAFSSFIISLNGSFFLGKYEVLEEIILPDTIETLEWYSISDCPALEKVVIPASVTSIWDSKLGYVFDRCPNIMIHTPAGSYAERYSQKHGIAVVSQAVADRDSSHATTFHKVKEWFSKLSLK